MNRIPDYDDNLWADRVIVYGDDEGLVFIPRAKALELAAIWKAVFQSKTWGELRNRMPPEAWKEFCSVVFDEDDSYTLERFREELKQEEPNVTEDEILAQYRKLGVLERRPFDDEAFVWGDIPCLQEPSWPACPNTEMLDWMPESVQTDCGKVGSSMWSGEMLVLSWSRADEIVRELQALGYTCTRDDELVHQTYGWGF
jgi:hypothetical protein